MTPAVKKGTKLLAIDAKEPGIPITEGKIYTVERYVAQGGKVFGDGVSGGPNYDEPGVTLAEVEGAFMLKRFEVLP